VTDELFDVFCPTCNIQVQARATCSGWGAFSSNAGNPLDEIETEYHGDRYSIALCPQCNDPFLIKQSRYSVVGEFGTVTTKVVLYPTTSRLPADGIPEPVSRAYQQALRCFSTSSYEASALMCRRSLEALCKSFTASGKSLQAKLDALYAMEVIDKRLTQWAHGVRAIGNEAAHDTGCRLIIDDTLPITGPRPAGVTMFSLRKRHQSESQ
jgi:hypothetical protein